MMLGKLLRGIFKNGSAQLCKALKHQHQHLTSVEFDI